MIRVRHSAVFGLLAVLLLAADTLPGDTKLDTEKLQGVWKVLSANSKGQPAPAEFVSKAKMTFDKEVLKTEPRSGPDEVHLTYALDASKMPKTIDVVNIEKKETVAGIYQLDGDDLKICLGPPGGARPSEFVSKEGVDTVLFVLKREKK